MILQEVKVLDSGCPIPVYFINGTPIAHQKEHVGNPNQTF
jgi:hypothetical protein